MKINGTTSEILHAEQSRELQKAGEKQRTAQPVTQVQRSDRVQISDEGRALAANAANETSGALSAERITDVRRQILSGAYNSLDVVDQVARKMLASGDI